MSVLVVGSVALDTITNPFGTIEEGLGGSAVYFSLAARAFTSVKLVAVVGTDFPEEHMQLLRDHGVDLDGLKVETGNTFRWTGEYSADLNMARTLDTQLNVFAHFKPVLPPSYRHVDSLFLANIDPHLQRDVLAQVDKPVFVGCDTMNFWIEQKREGVLEVLKLVDVLFINEDEARMLTGMKHLFDCAQAILALGPNTVAIKRGASGVALFQQDRVFVAPVYLPARAVDTTGAGDSFAGGFMGFVTKAQDHSWETLKRAAVMGTLLASLNIESFSIHRLHTLKQTEIMERWLEFQKMTEYKPEPAPF
ncbi:sugar kinase [bacterium]|nr:sugar kinase [bacterium]